MYKTLTVLSLAMSLAWQGGGASAFASTPAAAVDPAISVASAMPATTVNVTTARQLQTALERASEGSEIVLENGTYSGPFGVAGKIGKAGSPVVIRAANQGHAVITGDAGFTLAGASYVTIQGLKFINRGTALALSGASNIRVTRNTFALAKNTQPAKWIVINGAGSSHNRIDHNEFGPRVDLGQMISIDGEGGQVAQYTTVEYNYFHDAEAQSGNGGETIRVGLSGLSLSDGFNLIQHNLFVNCDSDAEVVSVKSGRNAVRYNTFRSNAAQVTARHGHHNTFHGNFFFGDGKKPGVGGFRIYGNDHRIYNNYLERLTKDAIKIDSGDYDGRSDGRGNSPDAEELRLHWKVYRAQVVNNTVVNSTSGIIIGGNKSYAPVDSKVANNIVKNTGGTLYNEEMRSNTVFAGNIGYGSMSDHYPRSAAEIALVDPLLKTVDGLQKLTQASPAINAAVGGYPFVTEDMDGQVRTNRDIGADEYTTAALLLKPLTRTAVGPDAP